MTNPLKTDKELLAEVLAEPYDPDWRRKIAKEIMDRVAEMDAAGIVVPDRELIEELNRRGTDHLRPRNPEAKQEGTTE